ncbi:glycosyltransferase family 2 protein [Desulfovibrio litoralis]|uniref:Glycosyltransferase 2-like domain-containing protein n=1 Tax=Desulfovibrio litoralis DSM 11393 TaxID=1121455 RepID=A0A1M7T698_9BACT|nr:glycosyltransferase family 2 protein [Desulfovibrio litoralis]SHN66227.1 hypothetical protein SAMN02745728_01597 [Desulfovibrio litoralis DSM 11393]
MFEYSIIIPVYNKYQLTHDCLLSLKDCIKHDNFEVIVVDNASSDESECEIPKLGTKLFSQRFTYIRNNENRNFAGACNQGAKVAKSDFLCFLNNDTIMTNDWDQPLLHALKTEAKLGAVGPVLLYADNTVQHIGITVKPQGCISHFYRLFPAEHKVVKKRRKLNFITAAVLMIHKNKFFAAGAFNEAYKNGFEDIELCFKLRELGFELSVIPESTVYHLESQSPGRKDSELNNANIFNTNFPIIPVDWQNILLDDGYLFSLNENFYMDIDIPKEHIIYSQSLQCQTTNDLASLLETEPYWQEGYTHLANIFEEHKDFYRALDVYKKQSYFVLNQALIDNANKILAKLDKSTTQSLVDISSLDKELLNSHKPERIRAIYKTIMTALEKYPDTNLKALIKEWRKKYGVKYLAQQ